MVKQILVLCLATWAVLMASAAHADIETVIANPGENASSQVNISWASHIPNTHVEYAPTSQWSNGARATATATYHRLCNTYDSIRSKTPQNEDFTEGVLFIKCAAELKDLAPDTHYTYRIVNADGTVATSAHHFKTATPQGEWSCCVISDFHAYTPLPGRVTSAMAMINKVEEYNPATSWVLHLGDVTAWGGSWSFWSDLYENPEFSRYMWAGVNGNHDNMTRGYDKETSDFFRDANYVPRNGYPGQEGVCYHFRYGEVMFVMLNNEVMRDSAGFAAASTWVRNVVNEARRSTTPPRYVIVCEHYQWFFADSGKASQYKRWSPIFDELGVDLALSGNNHMYASTHCVKGGKVTDGTTGTVYVQTASSDNGRGRELGPLEHNQDLIKQRWSEGAKTVSAISMTVNEQRIVLTLLDRYGNIHDTVEVKAKQ